MSIKKKMKRKKEFRKKKHKNNETVSLEAPSFTFVWFSVYSECVWCNTNPLWPPEYL